MMRSAFAFRFTREQWAGCDGDPIKYRRIFEEKINELCGLITKGKVPVGDAKDWWYDNAHEGCKLESIAFDDGRLVSPDDSWLSFHIERLDQAEQARIASLNGHGHAEHIDPEPPPHGAEVKQEPPKNVIPWQKARALHGVVLPDREWIVRDIIPAGEVTLLNGHGAVGKTLIALQLCIAVDLGTAWLGHAIPLGAEGATWFLTGEETKLEIERRVRTILAAQGKNEADLTDKFEYVSFRDNGIDPVLAREMFSNKSVKTTALYEELLARAIAERPKLIVLENVAQMFAGSDIDRAIVTQFVNTLAKLATLSGAAVVLLQHVSMAGMQGGEQTSGSTQWHNAVRSRFSIAKFKGDDAANMNLRIVQFHKANYAKDSGKIVVEWINGAYVPVGTTATADQIAENRRIEDVFLQMLDARNQMQRYVGDKPGHSYAPAEFAASPGAAGISSKQFKDAMERLFAASKIRIVTTGPDSKRRSHIERALVS